MKVNGPGQPPAPAVPDSEIGNKADKASKAPGGPADAEKSFAERVAGPRGSEAAAAATPARTAPRPGDVVVNDVAADLRTGKLTPQAAIEKVLDRIVERQIGPEGSSAVRDQVRSALQDAVENDPLLAGQLRDLAASTSSD